MHNYNKKLRLVTLRILYTLMTNQEFVNLLITISEKGFACVIIIEQLFTRSFEIHR